MQVCRMCLERDIELHDVESCGLRWHFEALTNCLFRQDGFPERLCWECRARLLSCARFREKALRSQALLAAATLFQQCNIQQVEGIDREEHALTSCLRVATFVDHYDMELCWSVKEEPEDVGHEVKEPDDMWLEVKEPIDTGHEVKEPIDTWHEVKEPKDTWHEVKEPIDTGHEVKEHIDTWHEVKEPKDTWHEVKEPIDTGHEVKEHIDTWHEVMEPKDTWHEVKEPKETWHEVKEPIDTGHEVKSELELGPELLQPDFIVYEAQHVSKQAESSEHTGGDDKCTIHVVIEEDKSQADIGESADYDEKNIEKFTCDSVHDQHMSPRMVGRGNIVYIKPDPEENPTRTMAASKTVPQHVMTLHRVNRQFSCCRCGRVFNRRISLLEHLMVHSGEKPFVCICGSKFIQKKGLKKHIIQNGCGTTPTQDQVQTNTVVQNSTEHKMNLDIAFECDECGKSYHLKSELRKHIRTHMLLEGSMKVSGNTYLCAVCCDAFSTYVLLWGHMKSEHPAHFETVQRHKSMLRDSPKSKRPSERDFKCGSCDFKSSRKQRLKEHVLCKHVDKKPYKCRYCDSRFNLEFRLRAHERVHTGERPYKCKYCSYSSKYRSGLCAHQKLHSTDKPHKCDLCDYRAARKQYLVTHVMNVHTRERPFKCEHCSFACNSNWHLKNHMLVHTSEKPYECGSCSFKTKTRAKLNKHVKQHIKLQPGTSVVESLH